MRSDPLNVPRFASGIQRRRIGYDILSWSVRAQCRRMDLSGHAGAAGELPVVPDPSFGDEAERHQSFAIVEADAARHGAVDVAECA